MSYFSNNDEQIKSKIHVYRTHVKIINYEVGDCLQLESMFSIWDPANYCYNIKGALYISSKKIFILPRGMDISYLEFVFGEKAVIHQEYDEFDNFDESLKLKFGPRDKVQVEAIKFMLGLENHFSNQKKSQLSINLPTGKGKTYVSIYTMCFAQCRSAVITSNNGWLEQWKNFILEYSNANEDEIYMIIGSDTIKRLLKNDISKYKFFLISHGTIKSYGEKNGWDSVTDLFKKLRIGIKIYDEAHLNFDNICLIDFYTNTKKTYYLTATPNRSDAREDKIYQKVYANVPKINLFDEDKDPHTKYIGMIYNSHPTANEISRCRNQYGFDRNSYTNTVVNKDNYYKLLTIIIDMALSIDGKTLIYIGTNDAIMKTKEWLDKHFPLTQVGIYTSIIDKDIKLEQLDKKIILSTTKSCGAASDIPNLKMTVVLAEPFKSQVTAKQSLGRTRDPNTIYIECVDMGFADCMRYYKTKAGLFKVYATSCTEVRINDDELKARYNNIMDKYWPIKYTEVENNEFV